MIRELPPCPCVSGYFPELPPTPKPLGFFLYNPKENKVERLHPGPRHNAWEKDR